MLNSQIKDLLAARENQSNLRALKSISAAAPGKITINGQQLINFASNDYLGLSQHPVLKEKSIKAIEEYGVGNPSSRLLAGNSHLYEQIESRLASLKGTEAALVFPTGFQTNLSVIHALAKLNSFFLCDKLSHNSTLLGAQLANKRFERFQHNNIVHLQKLLTKHFDKNIWIVTESVFSMDGDFAPVNALLTLSRNTQSYLYVDEAHATGLFGDNGMGLVHNPGQNTLIMGTFGKGCGSFGAYIACSNQLKDYLVNFCSGLIYTTALPPSVLAAIEAALEIIPHMVSERQSILDKAASLKAALTEIGFNTGESSSPIICLYVNDSSTALSLSEYLQENNIYARAVRPPTVPENTARIRISLSALHSNIDIEYLLTVLKNWHGK